MTVYALSKITKTYGSRTVLSVDSLKIEKGRIYALLGPNGAGKTTLLNILGLLDNPTGGSYVFHETEVANLKEKGNQSSEREHWICFPEL